MTNANEMVKTKKKNQRGIALLIAIFALLLVTGIVLAMMSSTDTESKINANYRDSEKAYFAALAGIQDARVQIFSGGTALPTTLPSPTNKQVIYLLNSNGSDSIQPWSTGNAFYDNELCHEFFPGLDAIYGSADTGASPNVPCTKAQSGSNWYTTGAINDPNYGKSSAMSLKWVRITAKENRSAGYTSDTQNYRVASAASDSTSLTSFPICWDGLKQVPLPLSMVGLPCNNRSKGFYYESVYRVASMAQTPSGARRMVLAEVALNPPLVTNAAVDSQDHVTLNGQLNVNGWDSCSCNLNYGKNGYDTSSCTTDSAGVTTCPNRGAMSCDNKKYAIYAAGTVDKANSSETLLSGQNPAVVQNQPWNYDIGGLINEKKQGAVNVTGPPYKWTCTAPTYDSSGNLLTNGSCGTISGSKTQTPSTTLGIPPTFPPTYNSDGSLNTSGQTPAPYSQVTYVPGNVKLTAGWNGNGTLIVDGDLEINGGLQFYGLILVRGVIKFTGGGSDATNIIGAVLAGQESYVDNTLGGSAVIDFNSCALTQNYKNQPATLVGIREATY